MVELLLKNGESDLISFVKVLLLPKLITQFMIHQDLVARQTRLMGNDVFMEH